MPTVSGMRRRGYTPASIKNFCAEIGVAKNDTLIDVALLEHCVREDLNEHTPRAMGVLHPLRLIIDNYPEDKEEFFRCANHPQKPEMGTREIPFSREIYIERDDFMEHPPKKYHRLGPGREVRLRNAYLIKFKDMLKDESTGEIIQIHCTYDPQTGNAPPMDGRKVQGVIHWVSARHAIPAEVRLYDRLFTIEDPASRGDDFIRYLNPHSLDIIKNCYVEQNLRNAKSGSRYQLERLGYFCVDEKDSQPHQLVLNRIVPLKDSWTKIVKNKNE